MLSSRTSEHCCLFALVGFRVYGRGVGQRSSPDLLEAAVSAVAHDWMALYNVHVELYVSRPAPASSSPDPSCTFKRDDFRALDLTLRFSVAKNSIFMEHAGSSALELMKRRKAMMETLGFPEVSWLPVSSQDPAGRDVAHAASPAFLPCDSYRVQLYMEGNCLKPFGSEVETALMASLAPLLARSTSIAVFRFDQAREVEGQEEGSSTAFLVSLMVSAFQQPHMQTIEQAFSENEGGLLHRRREGEASPLEARLQEVGLPVQTVSLASLQPTQGAPPITLYDWVKYELVKPTRTPAVVKDDATAQSWLSGAPFYVFAVGGRTRRCHFHSVADVGKSRREQSAAGAGSWRHGVLLPALRSPAFNPTPQDREAPLSGVDSGLLVTAPSLLPPSPSLQSQLSVALSQASQSGQLPTTLGG
eukprot:jgi/Botrbrau1/12102/Bobra.0186s0023.1